MGRIREVPCIDAQVKGIVSRAIILGLPFMSVLTLAKRIFLGKPIATKHAHHQRLSKLFALPVFASDALSSVAYATEATMGVLGAGFLGFTFPISIAIS